MSIIVQKLIYTFVPSDGVVYENCPPKAFDFPDFQLVLANDILELSFKKDINSLQSAKNIVEHLIKSWEIHDAIKNGGRHQFKYKYKDSIILDTTSGSRIIYAEGGSSASVTITANGTLIKKKYPEIPMNFEICLDVETLWFRYQQYLSGRDLLQSMAYFCLSYIEFLADGSEKRKNYNNARGKAALKYKIDRDVLKKLGELTAEKGDRRTARKADNNMFSPLTIDEANWIERCVLAIINRLGEYQTSPNNLIQITLQDLPKI